MYSGKNNREIAAALRISWKTTATYYANLRHKIGARSRAQLVAIAVERGIVGKVGELGARCAALEDFMFKVLHALPKNLLKEMVKR